MLGLYAIATCWQHTFVRKPLYRNFLWPREFVNELNVMCWKKKQNYYNIISIAKQWYMQFYEPPKNSFLQTNCIARITIPPFLEEFSWLHCSFLVADVVIHGVRLHNNISCICMYVCKEAHELAKFCHWNVNCITVLTIRHFIDCIITSSLCQTAWL